VVSQLPIYYFFWNIIMIYLYASSSNSFTFIPSGSYSNGDEFVISFRNAFSEEQFVAQATGSKFGNWFKSDVDITSSYTIGVNKSKLPLVGGTYEVNVFPASLFGIQWDTEDENWELESINWDDAFAALSVYGTEPRLWSLMGQLWSSVPAIPTTNGTSLFTTKAYVSESVPRAQYTSTNENAAYVVFNG
jgi:hypothetical protein